MSDLTEREVEVLRLKDEEKFSWAKIGDLLGTTKSSVNSSYRAAKLKMDRAANPEIYRQAPKQKPNANKRSVEVTKPDETAALLDTALEPFVHIEAAAKACGFPSSTARRLVQRMAARYKPLRDAIQPVKDEELILLLQDRALRCLQYADDFAMAGASLKDLLIGAAISIDKAQLLKGEPTAITKFQDIRKLDEVGKLLHAEMERRGLIVDVTPDGP